jgi:hypothetical protein
MNDKSNTRSRRLLLVRKSLFLQLIVLILYNHVPYFKPKLATAQSSVTGRSIFVLPPECPLQDKSPEVVQRLQRVENFCFGHGKVSYPKDMVILDLHRGLTKEELLQRKREDVLPDGKKLKVEDGKGGKR